MAVSHALTVSCRRAHRGGKLGIDSIVETVSRAAASASSSTTNSKKEAIKDLRACIAEARKVEPNFERMAAGESWSDIHMFVRKMCEVMVQNLPTYWRVVKHYLDGKFVKRVSGGSDVHVQRGN